jgi:hypothetical protein
VRNDLGNGEAPDLEGLVLKPLGDPGFNDGRYRDPCGDVIYARRADRDDSGNHRGGHHHGRDGRDCDDVGDNGAKRTDLAVRDEPSYQPPRIYGFEASGRFADLPCPVDRAVVATILLVPGYPHGLIPFVLIMSVEILMSTCLVTAVSVTTESQGWTIAATQMGVLGVNGIGWSIVRFPGIGGSMTNTTMRWSSPATALLTSEIAAIGLVMAITFFVQTRKKDFV